MRDTPFRRFVPSNINPRSAVSVTEDRPETRDKTADWRLSECLRILGDPDVAQAFALSKVDLHKLERWSRNGATPYMLREWLLT